jgi:hypothetical protein
MKAFIFRSAVKSVRYEVFETIINIYCQFICLCGDEFIVFILDVHRYSKLCAFSTFQKQTRNVVYAFNIM